MHKEMEKLSDDLQAAMKRVAALESALQASREEQRATALQVNPTDIVDAKVSEIVHAFLYSCHSCICFRFRTRVFFASVWLFLAYAL